MDGRVGTVSRSRERDRLGGALTRNSVGSKQLKPHAVKKSDLARDAVTSSRVADGSLLSSDFAAGQIPAGSQGQQGEPGVPGVVGAVTVEREDLPLADGQTTGVQVPCPTGTTILGGGASIDATTSDDVHIVASRPFRQTPGAEGDRPSDGETFDAWRVVIRNPPGGTAATTGRAFAICAEIQPPTRATTTESRPKAALEVKETAATYSPRPLPAKYHRR